ncbi:hypothetical protein GP486_006722, partial [Trichoglossum hirsutum]
MAKAMAIQSGGVSAEKRKRDEGDADSRPVSGDTGRNGNLEDDAPSAKRRRGCPSSGYSGGKKAVQDDRDWKRDGSASRCSSSRPVKIHSLMSNLRKRPSAEETGGYAPEAGSTGKRVRRPTARAAEAAREKMERASKR